MPRAYDRFPAQRGAGRDSLYSPTRGGLPWQNPLDAITDTAADTAAQLGKFVRDFLALDQLEAAFTEFAGQFSDINWASPDAVRTVIAAAGKLLADIGRWILQVFQNFTRLDLGDHSQFVADLIALFAFDVLHEAWDTFSTGWTALNWANPATAIHPAWMLAVDFGWDIAGWFGQLIDNILGIELPGWFALDDLRAHWTGFFTAWGAINWTNPLAGIHAAWMALVDLGSNLWDWAMTVLRNITGIELPDFLDLDVLKGVWQGFTDEWEAINWLSLTAIWSALSAIGSLLRGVTHWAIGVFRNLTGIDLEGIAASFGITALAAALTTWATTLGGLDWGNPVEALMGAIAAFIALFQDLGNWLLGVIEAWLGWAVDAVHDMFSSVGSFVARIVEYFWGVTGLDGWIHTLESLAGEVGATITDALRAVYDGVTRFVGMFGEFTGLAGLVSFFADIFGPDGLLGWLARVRDQITQPPVIDFSLDGIRQKIEEMFGGIPVSQINNASVNLISQGNFNNEITIDPGGGWSWDSTVTATGTGGSAKCEATGSLQQLFSRQVVKVANSNRVDITARVKTSGFTAAAGRYMELAIIPWKLVANVMTAQTPVVIATRTTASAGSFATLSGTTYVVANDIIRLTVRLSVVANSGAVIWFDDVSVVKSGGLLQDLVDKLPETWGGFVSAVFGGSGVKTWLDAIDAVTAVASDAGDALGDVGDLTTGLSTSPHSWIGSILSVVVDGVTNFQGFLNTLAIAMGGSGSANKVSHVGTRATAVTSDASDALENAGDALDLASGTNTAAYNAWYGSGGTGGTANMTAVINSIKSSVADGWTVEVINTSGTWTRPAPVDRIIEFWAICIGGGGGGDKGESKTTGSSGGDGGIPGRWMAKQITPSSIGSTVSVTVGAGGAGRASHLGSPSDNGGASSFGSLCSSSEALTASIGSLVGFYSASDSRPGVGGRGGDEAGGAKAGTGGGSTPLASGGAAGGVSGGQGASGGPGGNANLSGAIRAGGGGGGGGGASNTPLVGGVGGAGGRPGGGGGGGGAAWSFSPTAGGNGGDGGHGNVVLLYRIKT